MTSLDTGRADAPTEVEPEAPPPAPPGGRRKLLLAAGALGLALALIGAGLALNAGGGGDLAVTAGTNVAVDADASAIDAASSPALIIDPTDANHLVAASRLDRPRFGAMIHFSSDGGRTWKESALSVPPGEDRPYAPDVAFDADGNLFALFTTLTGPSNTPGGVWLERSTDGGATFSEPVQVTGPYAFQARLAVAPDGRRVHVTWVQSTAEVEQLPGAFPSGANPVVMATSSDGGSTFAAPVQVSSQPRQRVGAATPIIDADGAVQVLYQDFGNDAADFENTPGPVHSGKFTLVLVRSEDGKTFSDERVVDDDVVPTERFIPYLPKHPSIAVDPEGGDLYVAWSDGRNGDPDVLVRRSEDGGRTWDDAKSVNEDARKGTAQYLPTVTVGVKGRVHVLYLDRRHDPDNALAGASLATSLDKGKTWASIAVSDALFDSRVGPGSERSMADPGSRLALAAAPSGDVYAAWTDARQGSLDTDRQDIYTARIRLSPK